MNYTIIKTNRNLDTLIPEELIRKDEDLVFAIESYCEENKLNPVYIDGSVAIFSDHLLMAMYPEELVW